MANYSTYSTSGITLTNFASQNPVTIADTGTLAPPGADAIGVDGTGLYTWTIDNAGLIATPGSGAIGVYLADGGSLANQASAAISANPTSGIGVLLNAGGIVTNQTSAAITGYLGIYDRNAAATVVNAGTIIGNPTIGPGVVLFAGGSLTNQMSGTITGVDGVFASGAAPTVVNSGSIYGGYNAVFLRDSGTVFNQPGGTIDGVYYGVKASGTIAATVTNQGEIVGQARAGVVLASGGSISNAGSGVITGGRYGVDAYNDAATIINLGTVTGPEVVGVILFAGGSISNAASAAILGRDDAIYTSGTTAATITNNGLVVGTYYTGAWLDAGGIVTNAGTGGIYGEAFGVKMLNATGTVRNAGTIASNQSYTAAGVQLAAGGVVTNSAGGKISSEYIGVQIGHFATTNASGVLVNEAVAGAVVNLGTIYASNGANVGAAVWIHGPGSIYNAATGAISGGPFGIVAYYQTTVLNKGSIGGTDFAFDASRPGYADRVIDLPGAVFSGLVTGGNPIGASVASTLELASGTSAGTLNGLGSQFVEFATVTIDAGATWTWVADATGAGYTITDAGTLTNTGSLGSPVTLGTGAVLTNASTGTIAGSGLAAVSGPNSGTATVLNNGLIDPATYGVYLPGGGSVTNAGGATIQGTASGVKIGGASATITNAGTILGGVDFAGTGQNLLVLDPGGVVASATASASAGNTLELASGASTGTLTGLGAQFVNFGSLQFDTGADWFVAGNTAGLAGPITGFAVGDTIELDGITVTGSLYTPGVLTLTEQAGSATLALAGNFATTDFVVTNVAGGAEVALLCFRAGTHIRTPRGALPVEQLAVGDKVDVLLGCATAPIVWIGHRTVECGKHPNPAQVWPVRVIAGAFGPGRPCRDLLLSPNHAVYVNKVLIPISRLINGTSIAQVPTHALTYYHIELPHHDVVLAEDLPVETYLDTGDRGNFANGRGPVALFPDFSAQMWEAYGCARLIVTGPELAAARALTRRFAAAAVTGAAGRNMPRQPAGRAR